jgi:hypothetical protein
MRVLDEGAENIESFSVELMIASPSATILLLI